MLVGEQNPDGGWSWLHGEESDAFGTGLSLWALARLGRTVSYMAVRRGLEYLIDSQQEDGTWRVRSTLHQEEGATPTGIYWGTGWAAIGLISALPADGERPS